MKTSFASPERVPQHAICHRGIVRSQTAGYPDIRNGTRSSHHPNRIGSRPSIESLSFLPSRSLGTGQLAGDVQRFYSHALRHRPTSRQGTHRDKLNSCGHRDRWSFPRFKFCQEPSRGLAKCFWSFPVVVVHIATIGKGRDDDVGADIIRVTTILAIAAIQLGLFFWAVGSFGFVAALLGLLTVNVIIARTLEVLFPRRLIQSKEKVK